MIDPLAAVTPPLDGRQFRWAVGTRPVALDDWLVVDGQRHGELAKKDQLLAERHDDAVATLPAGDEAAEELLAMITHHLRSFHSSVFEVSHDAVRDGESGRTTNFADLHPIDAAGRIVEEDLCILTRSRQGAWVLTSASVCFTARWTLRDKLGEDLQSIHGPVPGYQARLGAAVEKIFERLEPGKPLLRWNWGVLDTDELHLPAPTAQDRERRGPLAFVRTERQTVRRLPHSGAVVFTILSRVTALTDVPEARRAQLDLIIAAADPAIAAYKGWL